jgi:hypothetical protein
MVVSYDLEGRELWRLKGMTQATPTPITGGGLLFVGSGAQTDAARPMYAIRPGATGDISLAAGTTSSEYVAWFQPKLSAYIPSPLFYRGRLYVVNDNGIMQVVDAATGKEIYRARVGAWAIPSPVLRSRVRDVCTFSVKTVTRSCSTPARTPTWSARQEQPGRNEPGDAGAGGERVARAHPDQALPRAGADRPGMISRIRRAMLAAVVGALAAALSLIAAYMVHPGLVFEMDRPLPPFIQGIFGNEHDAQGTFAWTSGHVSVEFPGLDRQVGWACTIRFRGPRPPGEPAPTLAVRVDGQPVTPMAATSDYQEMGVLLPPAPTTGASILMDIAPTFTPGTDDKRVLGIQLDRFLCRPSSSIVRPPSDTLSYATLAAAIFSAGLALLGLSLSSAMFAAAAIGLGQTLMMVMGSGMYGDYPGKLPWLALGVVGPAFLLAQVIERWRREPLSSTARFVVACCAAVLFLKLAGLYHPAKPIGDADFNMHRLAWVLDGRRFFTQPLGNGVEMPYAIGFYIFAAPWGWLFGATREVVWTVAAATDVIAGALLYPVMLKAWGDRRAAALAAVLFQLVPLPFGTLGNANLPNMFGQALALIAMLIAVAWRLDVRRIAALGGFTFCVAWAFCSHISTVTIFTATLGILVVLYVWRGDVVRRRAALAIVAGTSVALAVAWFLFYRYFVDEFRTAYALTFHHRCPTRQPRPPSSKAT